MLRVLMQRCSLLAFFSLYAGAAHAASALPDAAEVTKHQGVAAETLQEASRLSTTQQFLKDIARNQLSLETLQAPAGSQYFNIPDHRAQANLQDLWRQAQAEDQAKSPRGIDVPVIFVSFSLPDAKLQELLAEAERVGAMVVLRGLVNDDLNTTLARISEITRQQGNGFVLDPTLFSRFGVEQVPTFLLPLESIPPCDIDDCKTPPHVLASGTVSLFYFLDLVQRTGNPAERKAAKRWLAQWEESR